MNIRFAKIRVLSALAAAVFFLSACGNDQPSAAENEAALPHNMEQTGTAEAESAELAAAKGKSATLTDAAALLSSIKSDTSGLLVVNFWKIDCLKCIETQKALQAIQEKNGEGKLRILSVNLDEETMTNGVNLVLRKAGIVSEVFQVKSNDGKWRNEISSGWQGEVPAIFVKSKDGIKHFQNRQLSADELGAFLQPLLL